MDGTHIEYETPEPGIARIWLAREDKRNAQDTRFLYELNAAFDRAARDDAVRVIVLAARGAHFSSGHDLREDDPAAAMDRHAPVGTSNAHRRPGAEGRMSREEEIYTGFSERWRNIPKPTIAAVQGKCIAGGLMLCWPCDLIVASDDAEFQDLVLALGIPGVEWFAHPWELGTRKAKEMLFTGAPVGAAEAHRLGMVNRVVPRDRLEDETLALARAVARQPSFALKLAKQACNAAEDAQGRHVAMQLAFAMHHLAHSHAMELHGTSIDPSGIAPGVAKPPTRKA